MRSRTTGAINLAMAGTWNDGAYFLHSRGLLIQYSKNVVGR